MLAHFGSSLSWSSHSRLPHVLRRNPLLSDTWSHLSSNYSSWSHVRSLRHSRRWHILPGYSVGLSLPIARLLLSWWHSRSRYSRFLILHTRCHHRRLHRSWLVSISTPRLQLTCCKHLFRVHARHSGHRISSSGHLLWLLPLLLSHHRRTILLRQHCSSI